MKRPIETATVFALALWAYTPAADANTGWPSCTRDDGCPSLYLSVITSQGNATLSVGRACPTAWRHVWGRSDASGSILQWFNENADYGEGRLCIPLHPDVDEIRITSQDGYCGYDRSDVVATASKPMRDAVLRRSGDASTMLRGCHASIGNDQIGWVAHGGITLNFADGYSFGDSYACGYFYGVSDGFGTGRVKPVKTGVAAIGQFNTYHYRVEILANGRDDWRWGKPEENEK